MSYTIIENADHAAWLESRTLGIGGSDAAAILGLNPYKSNVELFDEKTGRRMPKDISDKPYVKYGTEAETGCSAPYNPANYKMELQM